MPDRPAPTMRTSRCSIALRLADLDCDAMSASSRSQGTGGREPVAVRAVAAADAARVAGAIRRGVHGAVLRLSARGSTSPTRTRSESSSRAISRSCAPGRRTPSWSRHWVRIRCWCSTGRAPAPAQAAAAALQGLAGRGVPRAIREVAEREIAGWRTGEDGAARAYARGDFEVICRAVFGVTEPERVGRLRERLVAVIDSEPVFMMRGLPRRSWAAEPGADVRARLARGGRAAVRGDPAPARGARPRGAHRRALAAAAGAGRTGRGDDRRGAPRRAVHDAGAPDTRRPPPDWPSRSSCCCGTRACWPGCGRSCDGGRRRAYLDAVVEGDAPAAPGDRRRRAHPDRAAHGGRLGAAGGVKVYPGIVLVHMREDLYPGPRVPPRAFPRGRRGVLSWLPFGGGIRRCIGAALAQAEMAEVLRVVVPRSSSRRCASTPDPVSAGVTLAPKHGVPVQVLKRLAQPAPVADPAAVRSTAPVSG